MFRHQVKSADQALAYVIDCTLATVADLAMKKSRSAHEFKRQKGIAQHAIDWAVAFGVDLSLTRAKDVIDGGGLVAEWAKRFDVKAQA